MGHYDTQFEQDEDDKRKWHRKKLETRLKTAVRHLDNDDLEKLAMAAENWDHVISVINIIQAMNKK